MVASLELFHQLLQVNVYVWFFGKGFQDHFSRNTELIHLVAPLRLLQCISFKICTPPKKYFVVCSYLLILSFIYIECYCLQSETFISAIPNLYGKYTHTFWLILCWATPKTSYMYQCLLCTLLGLTFATKISGSCLLAEVSIFCLNLQKKKIL